MYFIPRRPPRSTRLRANCSLLLNRAPIRKTTKSPSISAIIRRPATLLTVTPFARGFRTDPNPDAIAYGAGRVRTESPILAVAWGVAWVQVTCTVTPATVRVASTAPVAALKVPVPETRRR